MNDKLREEIAKTIKHNSIKRAGCLACFPKSSRDILNIPQLKEALEVYNIFGKEKAIERITTYVRVFSEYTDFLSKVQVTEDCPECEGWPCVNAVCDTQNCDPYDGTCKLYLECETCKGKGKITRSATSLADVEKYIK